MIEDQRKLAKLHTLGLIIINKNSTIYQKIFGDNDKISTKSLFVIGSVTKSFTVMATLKLGVSLNKTLGQFDLGEYIDEEHKTITVAELLSHTSDLVII